MADMELLLVYAWWRSLCVQEKGEVFATESTEEHGKMKRKGLFCHEIHEKTRTKIHYEKTKAFYLFLSCSFVDFVAKKSVSLFFPCPSVDSVAKRSVTDRPRSPGHQCCKPAAAGQTPGRFFRRRWRPKSAGSRWFSGPAPRPADTGRPASC